MQIQIGGEPRQLGDFSAFKAVHAMEVVGQIEETVRELVHEGGDFRREYERRHFVEMTRAEARRQYRPQPLYVQEEIDEGRVRAVPVMRGDVAVLGPDPLGHLTDADWEASGNVLRIPETPDENAVIAALVPKAFASARVHVMRLLALVVTPNSDLEKWDGASDIDAELDTVARELMHRADAEELIRLAVAAIGMAKAQIAGPFVEAREAMRTLFASSTPATTERVPEPMTIERDDESSSSPTSSTSSPADTDGTPPSSATEPAGVS